MGVCEKKNVNRSKYETFAARCKNDEKRNIAVSEESKCKNNDVAEM